MSASTPGRVANIGPRERRKRYTFGGLALLVSIGAGAALIAGGAPLLWRLALFLPLFLAALGYFQGRDKT